MDFIMQPDRPIMIFSPPEVLDPRVLEAWAPAVEARITRVKSEEQLIASLSHKAR